MFFTFVAGESRKASISIRKAALEVVMTSALRRMRLLSEVTTGVGWDGAGGPDTTGIALSDNGRDFANSKHLLTRVIVDCSGQVRLNIRVQGLVKRRKRFLRMRQTLTGAIDSVRAIQLNISVPAGQSDFWCLLPYAYKISVPPSQYSKFLDPAQPSIDVVDRIDNSARLTILGAEDLGQIAVTYQSSAP